MLQTARVPTPCVASPDGGPTAVLGADPVDQLVRDVVDGTAAALLGEHPCRLHAGGDPERLPRLDGGQDLPADTDSGCETVVSPFVEIGDEIGASGQAIALAVDAPEAAEAGLQAVDGGFGVARAATIAKAEANRVMHKMANEGIQLHGGIGMTDEYDVGFYLKRARVLESAWGSSSYLKDRYAKLASY